MIDNMLVGNNIRSLRIAYGESQEELGRSINVTKNSISNYENGRIPNQDVLTAISHHFMVSINDLLNCDLSNIGKIKIKEGWTWEKIDKILPIIQSDIALKNNHFQKAYRLHTHLYTRLSSFTFDESDGFESIITEYFAALSDEQIKPEVSANIISILYILLLMSKTMLNMVNTRPAALKQLMKESKSLKNKIEGIEYEDMNFENLTKKDADQEMIMDLLTYVKKSKEWSELADYYLALFYIWNFVDNEFDWVTNQRIGAEMIYAFALLENPYAMTFAELSMQMILKSPQIVDDK